MARREAIPAHRQGRPLRFLAAVLALWVGGRLVVASPWLGMAQEAPAPESASSPKSLPQHDDIGEGSEQDAQLTWTTRIDRVPITRRRTKWAERIERVPVLHNASLNNASLKPVAIESERGSADETAPMSAAPSPLPAPGTAARPARRWSGSAWLFWRARGTESGLTSAGQLGGSQAGVRIERRIGGGQTMPVLLYGRATAALKVPHQSEAALGVAVRPLSGQMPLTLGIERRIALQRSGRSAFALIAAGGLNPTHIGPLVAEGYGQAGMVGFARRDLFADGRASLGLPLDRAERTRAGISLSGGAQPGVSRLDIGPTVETRLPLGPLQPRLVLEWRQRIAGGARPGSGLSLTLASDF